MDVDAGGRPLPESIMVDGLSEPVAAGHKLLGVQYLRGVAALMVVYFHLLGQIPAYTHFLDFHTILDSRSLGTGVHIFFVISGFIMMATTQRILPRDFVTRRLIRIIPLYWLLTAALIGLYNLHYFQHTRVTPQLILKSLLFIPYLSSSGRVEPLLIPGWTLNVEMFFYATFAVALWVSRAQRLLITTFCFIALVFAGLALSDPADSPILWLITRAWMLDFCTGMLIGHVYLQKSLNLPTWLCGVLVFGGFGLLLSTWLESDESALSVLPATFILLGVVAYEVREGIALRRIPLLLGEASYSIYLSHTFVLGFVSVIWKRAGLMTADGLHAATFAIVSFTAAIGCSLLVYWWVEMPLLQGLSRRQEVTRIRHPAADS